MRTRLHRPFRLRTLPLVLVATLAGCGGGLTPEDITLARERTAAHFAKDERARAREALAPLVRLEEPAIEDLVRAAAIELADNQTQAARAFLDKVVARDGENAAAHYLLGQIAREAGEAQNARVHLRLAHQKAPDDLPTRLALAEAEDETGDAKEAERLYESVVRIGIANGGSWYVAAVYRLSNLLTRAGREEEAARFDVLRRQLEVRQVRAPDTVAMLLGELARVRPPRPDGSSVAAQGPAVALREVQSVAAGGAASRLFLRDIDGDHRPEAVRIGSGGVEFLINAGGRLGPAAVARAGAVESAVLFDAENDGDLDLVSIGGGTLEFAAWAGGRFEKRDVKWPELTAPPAAVVAVDYDHEGDLDLVLVGPFGARVWRNDSAIARSAEGVNVLEELIFRDATADSGLPTDRPLAWCVTEDFDGDNDVDLLLGGPGGIVLYDSLRDGKFAARADTFDTIKGLVTEPLVADFDGDARADLWFAGAPSWLVLQGRKPREGDPVHARPGSLAAVDLDLDGALDVLWLDQETGTTRGILALGLPAQRPLRLAAATPPAVLLAAADVDGDQRNDLVIAGEEQLRVLANQGPSGRGVRLAWRGVRDNRRGVGAVIEVRADRIYRRIYWRGEPEVVGVGGATRIDVLRVTWPNGVVATELDLDPKAQDGVDDVDAAFRNMTQTDGQVGSCPFLYAWNGTTFTFVSDVLGTTPLGLRMAPGKLVPPDHDEYVLVTGEQLVQKDGEFVLQITEELREVTYLDHARLVVVDHPVGTELYPNELFQFPPFPEHKIHTLRAPLAPTRALGSDGRDWREALLAADDVVAQPMRLQPPQFAGLAEPWFLELAFDRDAVARARKLRLALTGWFYWSDASANMASARAPGVDFVPPILQVPDGQGGWRDAGPPVGFPAGKTKTMVVDVSKILVRDDPRIRVATTLRLYWDRVVLAVDDGDEPLHVLELPCTAAFAWQRGFSAPLDRVPPGEAHPANRPERFDWDVLAPEPRWNQHPGRYTRYGPCRELLDVVDDQFVILGAGDALTLRFAAGSLGPPAEGMRRDYLLYLDGWAKDRDPNTLSALEVEPLPFHGMSGYPYGPKEKFPDGPEHQRWRGDWLTRPARNWIVPVSPVREADWLLSGR